MQSKELKRLKLINNQIIKEKNILKKLIKKNKYFVEKELLKILNAINAPKTLKQVMKYSVLNGGKRIRPFILAEVSKIYGVKPRVYKYPSMAIEMVHCFSLIYDDLPCMDDDSLRRGKPTVHVAFNEANALLGGASLLVYSYNMLANKNFKVSDNIKNAIIEDFSFAIGAEGMLAGQFMDLEAESSSFNLTLSKFKNIQKKKTSLLIGLSSLIGAKLGNANSIEKDFFYEFGIILGRIFQITDDLLDLEGNEKILGKKVRKDEKQNKATIIRLKDINYAKKEVNKLANEAKNILKSIKKNTNNLEQLVNYLVKRNY